ncbi:MAG: hypothetical protein P4L90_21640 [Rhodopila sp.]|nr:hypothetical protein [Rhodopila sp.]
MIEEITTDQVREAAATRILAKRDQILAAQRRIKEEQLHLAARERELDRELAECRAAAKFFDINFDPPPDDGDLLEVKVQVEHFRSRAADMGRRGLAREAATYSSRAEHLLARLQAMGQTNPPEVAQPAPAIPAPSTPALVVATPAALSPDPKMPKVRDLVLDQLRVAEDRGQKASPIKRYIESTYSTQLHSKTVGMTLYRLSQEGLVHRRGQTWFYGPQAGRALSVSTEAPGVVAPGITQTVVD